MCADVYLRLLHSWQVGHVQGPEQVISVTVHLQEATPHGLRLVSQQTYRPEDVQNLNRLINGPIAPEMSAVSA